ncbi:uncharacterized protein LOC129730079 [Wyeomyia smithii]|uniref:uncharacterized protein LOC129730079 n=1 Tax=Wyeomyia smithii TaxID=174621 RepID=UPI002467C454|nr:uncharacterized protein LOC129730079 [Wyeomyia smithii]
MDDIMLIYIILLSSLFKTYSAAPFTFPDDSRSSQNRSQQISSRQDEFEGRSLRGGYSQDKRPDYSRYSVYEHEYEDLRRSTTTVRPYLTTTTARTTLRGQLNYSRRPNAYFNRLPPPKNDEPIDAEPEDDYSDENVIDALDPVTSNPVASADYSNTNYGSKPTVFSNNFYDLNHKFFGLGNIFGEDRRKHKFKFKRRKPGQPCIPYDFYNRYRSADPKTLIPPLNLVLADVNYYSPSNNYNSGHGVGGSDTPTNGQGAIFHNNFYDAVGGYPCVGTVSSGHKPHKPHKPHGGPLGFFGQGGLFDWAPSADAVQSDTGVGGTSNRPTVVFNLNDAIDTVATNWKPGESFQNMMKVIAEFITSVAGGAPVAASEVVGDTVDTVRKVNREFVSLFT